jgi:hypothetical protein
MKAAFITITIIALAALGGFPRPAVSAEAAKPDRNVVGCEALIEHLHALEALAAATRQEIVGYRQEAERLTDWFGLEQFGAYVDALRRQERILAEEIEDLRTSGCRIEPPE